MTSATDIPAPDQPASPCTGMCRMDEKMKLCTGCLRSMEEITQWPTAGENDKRTILQAIQQRRAAILS
ncbi:DUF1289 domain-containing protein [Herminiimonas sp. NPDC097707]|uniref:DUF1289 domain-containing protein n=1 Tax=Herminiimonas sp. NPDC097707 TaxID=3364007 RepID=UPI00383B277F